VLPGAVIVVTNEDTSVSSQTVSSETGAFIFPTLQPGRYTVRAEVQGFKASQRAGLVLESARDLRNTYILEVGDMAETVAVTGGAPLVSTVSSEQRVGLDQRQLADLPALNRNITSLLSLSPGVQLSERGGNRSLRLSGMGGHSTSYAVDGVEATGQADGRQMSAYGGNNRVDLLGSEAVQEVQIVKGVIPAEYAYTLSGQVNIITKSGTSQVHGSVFEMYQSSAFAANDPFLKAVGREKPEVEYNQFGGSLGFPILQNRRGFLTNAFGYGTYEGYREERGRRVQTTSPTQLARNVLLSSPHFSARERQLLETTLATLPVPNEPGTIDNRTCAACGGQTGLSGVYSTDRPELRDDDTFMFKGDLHFKEGSTLALSLSRMSPFARITSAVPMSDQVFKDRNNRYGANWLKALGHFSLDVRWGYTWNEQTRETEMINITDPLAPPSNIPFDTVVPSYGVSGLFTTPVGELRTVWSPTTNINTKVAYLRGDHTFKFGGNWRHQAGGFSNPQSAEHRHDTFEGFYNNRAPEFMRVPFAQPFHDFPQHMFGLFVQDDWRVRNNLTLNLGLRYDYIGAPSLKASTYDKYPTSPDQELSLRNLAAPTDWPSANFGGVLDVPLENSALNFAPRIGFNWDVKGDSQTVVRGGFAQVYAFVTPDPLRDMIMDGEFPRFFTLTGADSARLGLAAGTVTSDARESVRALLANSTIRPVGLLADPEMGSPNTMIWMLGMQRALTDTMMIEVDYVANKGSNLPLQRWVNQPSRATGVRANPDLLVDFYMDSSQESFYNGVQLGLRKRYSKGLLYGVNYTFGKALATSGGDVGNARAASDNTLCCQEFFDLDAERARAESDIRHDLNAHVVYELPSGPSVIGKVFGGFSLSGILRVRSGNPIGVTQANGGRGVQRPDLAVDDVEDALADGDYRDTLLWWDRAAFVRIPAGVNGVPVRGGNAARVLIDGPGTQSVDLSLSRNFPVVSRVRLQLRWDILNALNRVNYLNPVSNLDSGTFGRIQGAKGMRQQQVSVKITF
jgi:hypothetical protein